MQHCDGTKEASDSKRDMLERQKHFVQDFLKFHTSQRQNRRFPTVFFGTYLKIHVSCEDSVDFHHMSQNATPATEFAPPHPQSEPARLVHMGWINIFNYQSELPDTMGFELQRSPYGACSRSGAGQSTSFIGNDPKRQVSPAARFDFSGQNSENPTSTIGCNTYGIILLGKW